ncbi:2-hydroxyhepta-2,4-diene-1,7-dioate isomerase [Mucilaginibacter corticis]|uniref:2-hydroxyhepta-2,4-diene-1,7-dioate isomerase n=1 Tax=Mucilaginibacter corticis TaxID=2597670 RepID=A0A556MC29_9SPHI|nr:fumarylacetoacetate hydrolase family protein [Mucilaginibacter corticis]TSJ37355.1 2-hydroxyhepta-2,4-diene-1,7-dioate isomerase [Mucilaginibacter corticis]
MKLFKTVNGIYLQNNESVYKLEQQWDEVVNRDDLYEYLSDITTTASKVAGDDWQNGLLPPIANQEVWAAGVTYLQSRDARVEESQSSGGSDLYKRVYDAERPEIFFKSTPQRVVGHLQDVSIRKDSLWNVPEPELTLFVNSNGKIQGYTVGNDMSSRSIEGENALYLPQAKTYNKSAAIGPCLTVLAEPISRETVISIVIKRNDVALYSDKTPLSRMKRSLEELTGFLFRELTFPNGVYLMTGTCLVPPNDFTLQPLDVVEISIDGIGVLINTVAYNQ